MKRILRAAPVLILILFLAGCVKHRWLVVEPGEYTRVRGTDEASRAVAGHIRSLSVDREATTATITLHDGSTIPLTLAPRERSAWPEGCPTNIVIHHMEVLDVEESNLSIASRTFQEPVLVRNCPSVPREIILREEGPVGGTGSACPDSCLVFNQVGSFAGDIPPSSLPHSGKGYELYSWQEPEGGSWHYTLVTGTDRQKTAEELTAQEDKLTENGWVKLTVTGTEALLELLGRLPAGEQVFWHGALAAPTGVEAVFRLPGETDVTLVEARCRTLGLELIVIADELEAILALPETIAAGDAVS